MYVFTFFLSVSKFFSFFILTSFSFFPSPLFFYSRQFSGFDWVPRHKRSDVCVRETHYQTKNHFPSFLFFFFRRVVRHRKFRRKKWPISMSMDLTEEEVDILEEEEEEVSAEEAEFIWEEEVVEVSAEEEESIWEVEDQ